MNFLGQTVVIIAMALIALSAGGTGYLVLSLKLESAAILAMAVFGTMVIFQLTAWRARDRRETRSDLGDIGRALENLTRDMAVLNNKMAAFEAAGVIRAAQETGALKLSMEESWTELQRVNGILHQHYELIQALRPTAVFGQKRREMLSEATQPVLEEDTSVRRGPLSHLGTREAAERIHAAIDQGRIEILLQPIVTLPQRKIRWYEVLSRLRLEGGETLLPEDFLPFMAHGDLGLTFDTLVLYRAVQLIRRMQTRNKEIGVVVNLTGATLTGGTDFTALVEFLSANSALSESLIMEISQGAYAQMGPLEFESLNAISQLGFRFSLDQVRDLRIDAKALSDRGFRFVKTPGETLLSMASEGRSDIHPADLSDLLKRHGLSLIADRIESESTVIDLLDYDISYAQGFLFAPPRPVKAEVLDDVEEDERAAMTA